jgi:hypothetical protein
MNRRKMGQQRCYEVCPEYYDGDRCSYCDMEELREWIENHPDEVYEITGVRAVFWLGSIFDDSPYNREGHVYTIEFVWGNMRDTADMNLEELTAHRQKIIEQMRRACRDAKRGLRAVRSKEI